MIAGISCPVVLAAQADNTPTQQSACVRAIPPDSMQRVVVYLSADADDDATRALLPNVGVLAQTVAERMRTLLGANVEQLPNGEPTAAWWNAEASIRITAHRDRRLIWSIDSATRPTATLKLLARALRDVQDEGDAVFVWPDTTRDSLVFHLALHKPSIDRVGHARLLMPLVNAIPAFSIAEPWEDFAHMTRRPHVEYPDWVLADHVEGHVIMQFVVDSTGRAEPGTIHDVWPADRPRLTGQMGGYYDALVARLRDALPNARFEPARIGGCPVPQMVQMPFDFKIAR